MLSPRVSKLRPNVAKLAGKSLLGRAAVAAIET